MKHNANRMFDVLSITLFAMSGFLLAQGTVAAWQSTAPTAAASQVPARVAPNTSSLNWSGYVAQGGSYTSVAGSWVVPRVDASNTAMLAADATWVGIGGVSELNLIQAGTQAILDGEGDIVYQPWLETIPGNSYVIPIDVHSGDSITTSIVEQRPSHWLISLRDNTTGQSYQTTLTHDSSLSSAEWIEEMPSSAGGNFFIPLDEFGEVPFTGGSTVDNGNPQTIAQSGAQPLTMTSLQGEELATTSVLSADGGGFVVTRSGAQAQMALGRRHSHTYTFYFTPRVSR
ncbi:MAG: hypothetical protein KGH79_04595 [Patescibacteria group bacterium]|nr:hypothetical protein [Patescibacteria group bacterium]